MFRCLNEYTFVCRSATYDMTARTCWLSRYTRRSHPELLEDDANSDYLENTCLNGRISFYYNLLKLTAKKCFIIFFLFADS